MATAERDQTLDFFAESHDPASPESWDAQRSVVIRRAGRLVAAGLLWPAQDDGSREVSLLAWPYEGPVSRRDKEACLASIVASAASGDIVCVDAHATEREEMDMMSSVPGLMPDVTDDWMAIVRLPVPGAPMPAALPLDLIPDEAAWARVLR